MMMMMMMILFPLFYTIISVQSKITVVNNTTLIKEGDPFTLVCDEPQAVWGFNHRDVARCKNCASICDIHPAFRAQITAFCNETHSILHFNSTEIDNDLTKIKCPVTDSEYIQLHIRVPVASVSIHPQSKVLVENEDGIFVCEVGKSKPKASFRWVIVYKNGSSHDVQQKFKTISRTLDEILWQTNSTLKLKLKRDYQKIMCKATIGNLPWTNSEYLSLDIKNKNPPTTTKISLVVLCILALIVIIIIIVVTIYIKHRSSTRQMNGN